MRSLFDSVVLVAGVTLLARLLEPYVGVANLALFYLLPVMVQSGRSGLRAGLITSVVAALAFNFFLVPPHYTLHIADPSNLVTMVVLFAVALVMSDLSSRLREQAARAERLEIDQLRDQLRETLLSSLSHDLRTPLTTLRAGLDELARDGEGKADTLRMVQTEALRLERMVANLLEMNRLETGATSRIEVIDLTDTVAAVIADQQPAVREAVNIALPDDLPMVRADPHMLHHMLLNLLENALRHGNGRHVAISARADGGTVVLQVSDRGPGIPVGEEDAIFSRFNRDRRFDRTGSHSGLGLAIVRGFGDAQKLKVVAANRSDGAGAIFSIIFPADAVVAAQDP